MILRPLPTDEARKGNEVAIASQKLSIVKLDEAIKAPPMKMIEREVGAERVLIQILYEIGKVNKSLNMNEQLKMSPEQCSMCAIQLLEDYENETIEDIALMLRRGATGRYDPKGLFRLDAAVIFRWMRMYLDEKYERVEFFVKAEKEEEKEITPVSAEKLKEIFKGSWVEEAERDNKFKSEKYKAIREKWLNDKKQKDAEATTGGNERQGHDVPDEQTEGVPKEATQRVHTPSGGEENTATT